MECSVKFKKTDYLCKLTLNKNAKLFDYKLLKHNYKFNSTIKKFMRFSIK